MSENKQKADKTGIWIIVAIITIIGAIVLFFVKRSKAKKIQQLESSFVVLDVEKTKSKNGSYKLLLRNNFDKSITKTIYLTKSEYQLHNWTQGDQYNV